MEAESTSSAINEIFPKTLFRFHEVRRKFIYTFLTRTISLADTDSYDYVAIQYALFGKPRQLVMRST